MSWTQVSLVVASTDVDAAEAALWALGALCIAQHDAGSTPWYEPDADAVRPWERVRLQALFNPDVAPQAIRDALTHAVDAQALAGLVCDTLPDRDWARAWMQDWQPLRFGARLWICPTWLAPPDPAAVNLRLDPGNAFGTGTHATTALCLEWLAAQDLVDCTLLDFGCGSGVLAIAALRLGAARAWGCDTDAAALRVTSENAARNGVADRLWIGAAHELPALAADVVVANILSRILIDVAPQLGRRLRAGGRLALAGILNDQADAVIRAYAPWCPLVRVATRDDWVLLAGTRADAASGGETAAGAGHS